MAMGFTAQAISGCRVVRLRTPEVHREKLGRPCDDLSPLEQSDDSSCSPITVNFTNC